MATGPQSLTNKKLSKKVERALKDREPKVHENPKSAIILKGPKTSAVIIEVLKDISLLKKPHVRTFKRKNNVRPFEDETSLEFFSNKNDCSLFAYGSHSKKRPHNLVFGRMFNYHILDMIELGVENFRSIRESSGLDAPMEGSKPAFAFVGEAWEHKEAYQKLSNLLIDFFRGHVLDQIDLPTLDHIIVCTALNDKIYFRHYGIQLKKSGTSLPVVQLKETGPYMDLTMRRFKFASNDLMKQALQVPREVKQKKVKNITTTSFATLGTVHKEKQDLGDLQTRKMKGLKRTREEREENEKESEKEEEEKPMEVDSEEKKEQPNKKRKKSNKSN